MVAHKCHFPFITFLDSDIIVSPLEIHFGEHLSPFELIDKLENERKGVVIFNHVLVQIVIVLYHTLFPILFGYEEHG